MLTAAPALGQSEHAPSISLTYAVTSLALISAALMFARVLRSYTAEADRVWLGAESAHRQALAARARVRELAEHGRLLHDTVLNTLAAIAAGGAAVSDPRLVRDRCARDVKVVEAMLAGSAVTGPWGIPVPGPGFEVEWAGLSVREAERHLSRLAPDVVAALRGAVGELVRNAHEHAGVDRARIVTSVTADAVVVSVQDEGAGFQVDQVEGWGATRVRRTPEP